MREPILKKVAMPPTLFWAPMYIAVMNFIMQMGIMVILIGAFPGQINPLAFIFSFTIVHVFLVVYGFREPHLSKILMSRGPFLMPTKNVYRSRGHKLAS